MNPEVTQDVVANTTPQLVFSGAGKVLVSSTNGNVAFGDASVSAANIATWMSVPVAGFHFCAPAEIYAVCINGATNQTVKIQRWF